MVTFYKVLLFIGTYQTYIADMNCTSVIRSAEQRIMIYKMIWLPTPH